MTAGDCGTTQWRAFHTPSMPGGLPRHPAFGVPNGQVEKPGSSRKRVAGDEVPLEWRRATQRLRTGSLFGHLAPAAIAAGILGVGRNRRAKARNDTALSRPRSLEPVRRQSRADRLRMVLTHQPSHAPDSEQRLRGADLSDRLYEVYWPAIAMRPASARSHPLVDTGSFPAAHLSRKSDTVSQPGTRRCPPRRRTSTPSRV
jgi:hypothetical protein